MAMTNSEYVARWREKHPAKYKKQRKKMAARTKKAPKRGHAWMEHEKLMLFDFPGTDFELAKELGRSIQAIQSMRHSIRTDQIQMDFYGRTVELPKKTTLSDQPRYKHIRHFKDGHLYEERLGRYEVQDEPDGPSDEGVDEV